VKIDCLLFLFFFSSRRRHTRSDRDWSSDVCSSDLIVNGLTAVTTFTEIHSTRTNHLQWNIACGEVTVNTAGFWIVEHHALPPMARSSATSAHALTSRSGSAEKKNSGWCSMPRRTL